jgi:hypothetical protein
MNRAIIVSPFAGDEKANIRYARKCMRHSAIVHGEAPFAGHLLYPQILSDLIPEQRDLGMRLARAWYASADTVAVYMDNGLSNGMQKDIEHAESLGLRVESRWLHPWI